METGADIGAGPEAGALEPESKRLGAGRLMAILLRQTGKIVKR